MESLSKKDSPFTEQIDKLADSIKIQGRIQTVYAGRQDNDGNICEDVSLIRLKELLENHFGPNKTTEE